VQIALEPWIMQVKVQTVKSQLKKPRYVEKSQRTKKLRVARS